MKFKKIGLEEADRKPFKIVSRWSEFGRSSVTIRCPFCGHLTRAYIWSLAGNGKRCNNPLCRAMFLYITQSAYKDVVPSEQKGETK